MPLISKEIRCRKLGRSSSIRSLMSPTRMSNQMLIATLAVALLALQTILPSFRAKTKSSPHFVALAFVPQHQHPLHQHYHPQSSETGKQPFWDFDSFERTILHPSEPLSSFLSSPTALGMVSQRAKRRKAKRDEEDRIRREKNFRDMQQLNLIEARGRLNNPLRSILEELREGGPTKGAGYRAQQTVQEAHNGTLIEDIGTPVRLMALEIAYRTNRPRDALGSWLWTTRDPITGEETPIDYRETEDEATVELFDQYKLWGHGKGGQWNQEGTRLAENFYADLLGDESGSVLEATERIREKLRWFKAHAVRDDGRPYTTPADFFGVLHCVLNAFVLQRTTHPRAEKLLLATLELHLHHQHEDKSVEQAFGRTRKYVRTLLKIYRRNENWKAFQAFFRTVREMESRAQNTLASEEAGKEAPSTKARNNGESKHPTLLDFELHGLALDVASESVDLEFLYQNLGGKKKLTRAVRRGLESGSTRDIPRTTGFPLRKPRDLLDLVLRTIVASAENTRGFSNPEDRELAVNITRLLLLEKKGVDPDLLSKVLLLLLRARETDWEYEDVDVKVIVKTMKNRKRNPTWYKSLSRPALAGIFPYLLNQDMDVIHFLELEQSLESDSWQALTSLLPIETIVDKKKNGDSSFGFGRTQNQRPSTGTAEKIVSRALSSDGRKFLRKQNPYFCAAALSLTVRVTRLGYDEDAHILTLAIIEEHWKVFASECTKRKEYEPLIQFVFENLSLIKDEKTRIELYVNIVNQIRQGLNPASLLPSPSLELSGRGSIKGDKNVHISKEDLNSIVDTTVQFFQSLSADISSNDGTDTAKRGFYSRLGNWTATSVFDIISSNSEFQGFDLHRRSKPDNGVGEALQEIMKQLILSDLFVETDSFPHIAAFMYYISLIRVSGTLKGIDYDDLLFPYSTHTKCLERLRSETSPEQDFRYCFTGTKKQKKAEGIVGFLDNFFISKVEQYEEDSDEKDSDETIAPLLKSVYDMAAQKGWAEALVTAYKDQVYGSRLFVDHDMLKGVCMSLDFFSLMSSGSNHLGQFGGVLGLKNNFRFSVFSILWGPDMANEMIDRLSSCKDAQWYLSSGASYERSIENLTGFLATIASQMDAFEFSPELKKAYTEACFANCVYIANASLSNTDWRRRYDSRREQWTETCNDMIGGLSFHTTELMTRSGEEIPKSYTRVHEDGKWSSYIDIMLFLLERYWEKKPKFRVSRYLDDLEKDLDDLLGRGEYFKPYLVGWIISKRDECEGQEES